MPVCHTDSPRYELAQQPLCSPVDGLPLMGSSTITGSVACGFSLERGYLKDLYMAVAWLPASCRYADLSKICEQLTWWACGLIRAVQ
jgi:hypothetical protein